MGPNGCGKSSLLRTLSRGVMPQKGHALLDGRDVRHYKRRELARRIAMLPQIHGAPADMDVRTLVGYGRHPYLKPGGRMSPADREIVEQALRDTHMDHLADRSMSTLSGGEQQRAWIAMTICQEPEILILDEPTTFLDVSHQMEILETVRQLNIERGITVVMVLHDLNLAARYSDALFAIKDGVIYRDGPPDEVMTQTFIYQIFGVESHIYRDEINGCPYFIPQSII